MPPPEFQIHKSIPVVVPVAIETFGCFWGNGGCGGIEIESIVHMTLEEKSGQALKQRLDVVLQLLLEHKLYNIETLYGHASR